MLYSMWLKLALVSVLVAAAGGGFLYMQNIKAQRDAYKIAATNQAEQIEVSNKNLAMMGKAYEEQQIQVRLAQEAREKARRIAVKREQELHALVASLGHDPDADRAINNRLRAALERIQGHVFDDNAGLPVARPAIDVAGNGFCFDTDNTLAIVTDFERVGDFMEALYDRTNDID